MPPKILDGKQYAADLNAETKHEIEQITRPEIGYRKPGLAVILVGDDPASHTFVNQKRKICAEVGIQCEVHELPVATDQDRLLTLIDRLNKATHVDGILLQLPLPKHLCKDNIIPYIDPSKDVDGIHPYNMGLLATGNARLVACTPAGIMHLLYKTEQELTGKKALVIGYSDIVGKPLSMLLMQQGATVTCCSVTVKNLAFEVQQADIVIAAAGVLGLVKDFWLKPGSTVIDVGIHHVDTVKKDDQGIERKVTVIKGDVDTSSYSLANFMTPVPGGVGPMTVSMVAKNTQAASVARQQNNNAMLDRGIFPMHRLKRKHLVSAAAAAAAADSTAQSTLSHQNGATSGQTAVKRVKIDYIQSFN
ncbi:MAG TPA: bifunctional 5,10-methylenetetrahydrofolate dehydrogenase/5,10-methenyltetrahydrofolate cyclohydrolase [Gammaproteobacteria bacterium]|nr:bifunctional 5,10-methylenetetrahydrofolate dehydrogenase/5,10-methenyltetrahydrofolate cyclohydrolase [Gammaproteobacteria bacterium]